MSSPPPSRPYRLAPPAHRSLTAAALPFAAALALTYPPLAAAIVVTVLAVAFRAR